MELKPPVWIQRNHDSWPSSRNGSERGKVEFEMPLLVSCGKLL